MVAACDSENLPAQQAPQRLNLAGAPVDFGSYAGTPNAPADSDWTLQHPICGVTKAGAAIAKAVPCTPDDVQQCFKKCGPINTGYKLESCEGAAYSESSICNFWPQGDFSCFRIPEPSEVSPDCPVGEVNAPRHNDPCTLPPCVVCGGSTREQTSGYRDSSQGLLKVGYCVCRPAEYNAAGVVTSAQKWACATMGTAWPCPNGFGC